MKFYNLGHKTFETDFSSLITSFDIFGVSVHCLYEEQLGILESAINYTFKCTAVKVHSMEFGRASS